MNKRVARTGLAILLALCAAPCLSRPATDNLVVSEQAPALSLRISADFAALPPLRFPIDNLTHAERRLFVEADANGRVRRMVVVQFERVQDGSAFRFVFPSNPPHRFGEQIYRSGAFVCDDQQAALRAPLREAALTRAHLAEHGLAPPRLWRVARLARVSDPEGLSEIILFYMENADADFGEGPLPGADEDGDLPLERAAREAIFGRLAEAVEVVRG